ncbi:IS4 family transposase [Salmonella enterica subsp. diarizonae]|nr:IS4 family transposase [Salmonella enterica subsp. diarizonae]
MPARKVCQNFFKDALSSFHQYRQNALTDATAAITSGAALTLSSIGRFLPGSGQVKNKIKRIDRLLGNTALQQEVPLIYRSIISMLTKHLSLCVIAVDWSSYPTKDFHILRASLICDGRSIPLLSQVVPCVMQQNSDIQNEFLDVLSGSINPASRVIIITDAGFHNAWFKHIKSLGWEFIGRIRGKTLLQLDEQGAEWLNPRQLQASSTPKYLGPGSLSRKLYARCEGHFYLQKNSPKYRKDKRSRGRQAPPPKMAQDNRSSAKEPWLIFSNINDITPRSIMKLYSRRMQIEQNFRDEKSERYGLSLRGCYSRTAGRILILSLLATLGSIVLWLVGYHAENKGLHLRYQANSIKSRRILSHLTLAKNILRQTPMILRRINLNSILRKLAHAYQDMVMVY